MLGYVHIYIYIYVFYVNLSPQNVSFRVRKSKIVSGQIPSRRVYQEWYHWIYP